MSVLVVYAHPRPDSFTAAVRDAVVAGSELSCRTAPAVIDLYREGFRDGQAIPGRHVELLAPTTHLILVYPTWWSGQPAILLAWIGQALAHLGTVERIDLVTTHGSPRRVNMLEGHVGRRMIRRYVRRSCAAGANVGWTAMYCVDTSTPEDRQRFLSLVSARFSRR